MSRTIKFRAWDKTNKVMLDRVLAGPGDPCSIVWKDGEWLHFDEACGEIMQFTGLFDSLKVGIYEGDIVRVEEDALLGVVEYRGACFIVRHGGSILSLNHLAPLFVKIVGNIYENPELLEAK